jgi:hypothetical protein
VALEVSSPPQVLILCDFDDLSPDLLISLVEHIFECQNRYMEQSAPRPADGESIFACLSLARDALGSVLHAVARAASLTDDELILATRQLSESRASVEAAATRLAAEVARRSAPELASGGLAQRSGFRTPERMLQKLTLSTGREASATMKTARLLVDSTAEPWLAPVIAAHSAGSISVAALSAIPAGLGMPNSAVSSDQLLAAAGRLAADALTVEPDDLRLRAQSIRDGLDFEGIAIREHERRQQRSLRIFATENGMGRLVWSMDPETFVAVKDLYDRAASPKLGGVRFGEPGAAQHAESILTDTRTPEQLASDVFVDLLRVGSDADSSQLLGSGAPVVKVTTTQRCRDARAGRGYFEGNSSAISVETVERLACEASELLVQLDDSGRLIDAARESRLYSARQREALAVRDGGCLFPDCSRPPSWCEAHHVKFWARDRGKTEVDNGVLLCRHHHLLIHNNGWEIQQGKTGERWLIPPANVDALQTPIAMPTKSPALRQLLDEQVA